MCLALLAVLASSLSLAEASLVATTNAGPDGQICPGECYASASSTASYGSLSARAYAYMERGPDTQADALAGFTESFSFSGLSLPAVNLTFVVDEHYYGRESYWTLASTLDFNGLVAAYDFYPGTLDLPGGTSPSEFLNRTVEYVASYRVGDPFRLSLRAGATADSSVTYQPSEAGMSLSVREIRLTSLGGTLLSGFQYTTASGALYPFLGGTGVDRQGGPLLGNDTALISANDLVQVPEVSSAALLLLGMSAAVFRSRYSRL